MNFQDKQLNLALRLLFIACCSLLIIRLTNAISFIQPLHVQTGGAEDTSFIGMWFIKNGIYNYNHYLKFNADLDNSNIFSLFHYNWLFYYINAYIIKIIQFLFNLDDLWIPTIVRLTCFIASLFCFLIYYKILNELKKNYSSLFLSFYLIFGPLTGYWVFSGKPDIFYIFFELSAIYIIIKSQKNRSYFNVFFITIFLYLSWSIKQNSIVTICSFALFLLWKRSFVYFFITSILFSTLVILTKFLGPDKLFDSIFWQNGAAISFSVKHFFSVFIDSISKGIIIYAALLCVLINLILKNNIKKYFKSLNDCQVYLLFGAIISTSQIIFSFHFGSAVNYYFIFFIYILLLIFPEIDNFIKEKKFKIIFIISVYLQIVLIVFIFVGIKGSLSPLQYSNINEFKKCVQKLKSPILSDHKDYYRLPWITPEKNPILVTMMYQNYIKNFNFENTPLYKAVNKGHFQTLIIRQKHNYNLNKYKFLKTCKSLKNIKVNIYVKTNQ